MPVTSARHVAPDGRDGMLQHAQDAPRWAYLYLRSGPRMPMFNGDELNHFIELATYVAVNDYQAELCGANRIDIARYRAAFIGVDRDAW